MQSAISCHANSNNNNIFLFKENKLKIELVSGRKTGNFLLSHNTIGSIKS